MNRWYLISQQSGGSGYNIYYAAATGATGFASGWTIITTISASYIPSGFVDTGTSVGFMIGYNAGTTTIYYWRSTNGTSFSTYAVVSSYSSPMPYGKWSTKNGWLRIANQGTGNTGFTSYDDGLTWSYGTIGGGTSTVWAYLDYSGGSILTNSSGAYTWRNTDTNNNWVSITSATTLGTVTPTTGSLGGVVNDRVIGYYASGTPTNYYYQATNPGVFPTSGSTVITYTTAIANPTGNTQQTLTFVPFGVGYALFPTTSTGYFYTSVDLKTWTARTISLGAYAYTAVSGNIQGYAAIGINSSNINGVEVWKANQTLTLS
jgi:hypothetical protein